MPKLIAFNEEARRGLGDAFDLRDFHDVVLGGGAVPLEILDRALGETLDELAREGTRTI